MPTTEIPQNEWATFFDTFSKDHQGFTATVQVVSEDVGVQEAVQNLPFVGISADEKGSDRNSVLLFLGTEASDHVEHRVVDPAHVWLKSGAEGADETLDIEGKDGSKTIVQLQAASK